MYARRKLNFSKFLYHNADSIKIISIFVAPWNSPGELKRYNMDKIFQIDLTESQVKFLRTILDENYKKVSYSLEHAEVRRMETLCLYYSSLLSDLSCLMDKFKIL